jgi:hypothetical protein
MTKVVKFEKVYKGLMTSGDKTYFTDVTTISDESGNYFIFNCENEDYFRQWLTRTKCSEVSDGSKEKLRKLIAYKLGDDKERIADAFKMSNFILKALVNLYTVNSNVFNDNNIKNSLNKIKTLMTSNSELFNIDTKGSLENEVEKLVLREKIVTDFMVEIGSESSE